MYVIFNLVLCIGNNGKQTVKSSFKEIVKSCDVYVYLKDKINRL